MVEFITYLGNSPTSADEIWKNWSATLALKSKAHTPKPHLNCVLKHVLEVCLVICPASMSLGYVLKVCLQECSSMS